MHVKSIAGLIAALMVPASAAGVTLYQPVPGLASDADDTTVDSIGFPAQTRVADEYFVSAKASPASLPAYFRRGALLRVIDSASDQRHADQLSAFSLMGTLAVVPEPRVWGLLLAGYGLIGFALRRRRDWARHVVG